MNIVVDDVVDDDVVVYRVYGRYLQLQNKQTKKGTMLYVFTGDSVMLGLLL